MALGMTRYRSRPALRAPLASSLDEDQYFHVVSNSRRRECIRTLAAADESVTVEELTQVVAGTEVGDGEPSEEHRKSVYVALRQTHLPTLQDADVVWFDPQTNVVRAGPNLDQIEPRVGHGDRAAGAVPWQTVVLAFSVLVVLWVVGGFTRVLGLPTVVDPVLAALHVAVTLLYSAWWSLSR